MQRVISRVHQIVTSSADATGAPLASESLEGLGAASSLPDALPPRGNTQPSQRVVTPSSASSTIALSASPPVVSAPSASAAGSTSAPAPSVSVATHKEIALAVERLQYATLLGERKKAVASLHDLARAYATAVKSSSDQGQPRGRSTPDHVALGLAAIPAVLNALLSDPRDTELMEAMLELLQAFVSTSPATATAMLKPPYSPTSSSSSGSLRSAAAAAANVAVSGTQLCLQLLQDPSPWIRGPTIALLKSLQEAQQKEFAASVLECKEGLRQLLEVVEDKRDHIRDAALQVLVKMTEREKNVQQFLAFEDGFVRLFQIMEVEGLREGSSVVSDCLQIINNMLRDNLMNQTLFRDLPYVTTHLSQLLSLPSTLIVDDEDTRDGSSVAPSAQKSTQKKRTMKLVLQLVRFLVSDLHEGVPDSKLDELAVREKARKQHDIAHIQSMITRQSELMGAIGEIVCCGNEEFTDLQLQALDMIQLLCSGNGGTQIILVNLQTVPSRQSLLSELIKLDIAEDETPVGAAATNLLDALFTKNESAKMAIFQHLNAPPPMDDDDADRNGLPPPIPSGRVLLDALISNAETVVGNTPNLTKKSISSSTILAWKACHRLTSLIADSAYCKELALRIPSQFDKPDAPTVSGDLFITRCLKVLSTSSPQSSSRSSAIFQVRIAMLTMLIQWCVGCTNAVRELVGSVTTLSILVDTLSLQHGDDGKNIKDMSRDEVVQVQGLTAILLGTCLEYLVPVATGDTNGAKNKSPTSSTPQLTRHNLVDLISKKIGLESFANMLVQIQQSPQVIACARTASRHQRARALLPHRAIFSSATKDDADADGYLFPLYDRSFTVLCRDLADKIQHRVLSIFTSTGEDEGHGMGATNTNAPSAASAYQDLIRIQDKQVQELQRQVSDLTAQLQSSASTREHSSFASRGQDQPNGHRAELEMEIQHLKSAHDQDKAELEYKVAAAMEQSTALESRLQGVSRALEHLEAEHSTCGQRSAGTGPQGMSSLAVPTDAMAQVMADLDRENGERRRLEAELRLESQRRQAQEKTNAQDSHAWQMTQLQLQQELDSLRTSLAQSEEQYNEQSEMIDVFRQGQESAKRSAAQLKLDLDRASQELASLRGSGATANQSPTSKHEAAAKEMYQQWEKERRKVRDLQAELENLKEELSTAASRSQQVETQNPENDQEQVFVTEKPVTNNVNGEDDDLELEQLRSENTELRTKVKAMECDGNSQVVQLNSAMRQQLEEISQLRGLLKDMQGAIDEAAEQAQRRDKAVEELNEELTQAEERADQQRRKTKATMTELEDEIARMFFEKTETQRKSKASLKQAEQEIARMFLEKVELEKQIAAHQGATLGETEVDHEGSVASSDDRQMMMSIGSNGSRVSHEMSPPPSGEPEIDHATAMDDMFIVLASLEIQCNTFRECLEAAQGEQAVVEAVQMSRKRGALML